MSKRIEFQKLIDGYHTLKTNLLMLDWFLKVGQGCDEKKQVAISILIGMIFSYALWQESGAAPFASLFNFLYYLRGDS